jgi:hypothetical protein
MYSFSVNMLAVLIAAVVSFIIGAFWYSPAGFLKPWMRITGTTPEAHLQKNRGTRAINYFLIFLAVFVIALVTAFFLKNLFVPTLGQALSVGFWLWFAGVGITSMVQTITQPVGATAGDQWKLFAINAGYYLVVFLVSALFIFILSS